jgi:CheY-like chemotaxis protein
LPKIFDLYVQAESTLTQSQGGLGIGLSLVRRLVTLHGGAVTAHSEGVGKGSEFIVRIPLSSHIPAASAAQPAAEKPLHKHCILVVDDNEASAQTLTWMMEAMGHEVKMANDGATALRVAPSFKPDVVLLDLGMPDIDGYEICRRLRKLPGFDQVKIIAQTGWGTPEQQQLSKDAGFDGHLIKPVDVQALHTALDTITTSCPPQPR